MNMPATQAIQSYKSARRSGPQRVFVYGTLKDGFRNHEIFLKNQKCLGRATVQGLMFHLGGFPAVSLREPFCTIVGEVYQVDWDKILDLDHLEGVDRDFYIRIETLTPPFGLSWIYIYPGHLAEKQDRIVPSGIWRGPDTPTVKWNGFEKGVEVGTFETNLAQETIRVGDGTGDYILRHQPFDSTYKLVSKSTGEVFGSFKHLRDMVGADGVTKPVLRLPAVTKPTVEAAVREELKLDGTVVHRLGQQQLPLANVPLWTPPGMSEESNEEPIPQAAKFLGLKYGAA